MNGSQLKSPKHLVATELQSLYYSLASTRVFFSEHMLERVHPKQVRDHLGRGARLLDAARHLVYCAFEDLGQTSMERICPVVPGIELEVQAALRDGGGTDEAIILRGLVKACLYLQGAASMTAQLAASCGYRDAYDLLCEATNLVEDLLEDTEELLFEELFLASVDCDLELAQ